VQVSKPPVCRNAAIRSEELACIACSVGMCQVAARTLSENPTWPVGTSRHPTLTITSGEYTPAAGEHIHAMLVREQSLGRSRRSRLSRRI
jgi:hypothetical protein